MGLAGARNSAVTGLQAQSTSISISADNIANANTTGFKAVDAKFSTLVTDSGTSTGFSSGGVSITNQRLIEEQGLIESTGRVSDLAVSGNGFFAVQDEGGSLLLTRDGSFDVNSNGELVSTSGQSLLGWPLDNDGLKPGEDGNTNTTASESVESLEVVDINSANGTASATTTVAFGMNLDASESTFQGATVSINFNSSTNNAIAQDDIIVPVTGMMEGDSFVLTSDAIATTFEYGGFSKSHDISETGIFGSTSASVDFTAASGVLAEGDQFTITTLSTGTVTFTFSATNTDTGSGEFSNLENLATAINAQVGLYARESGGIVYVSAEDATEAITFGDVSNSNLHNELGFGDVQSTSLNRFNSVSGLETLVQGVSQLNSVVSNPTSGVSIELFSSDPLLTLTLTKNSNIAKVNLKSDENANNASDTIIVPPRNNSGTVISGMAIGSSNLVLTDGQATPVTVTLAYGGIAESSNPISTDTAVLGATTTTAEFSSSVTADHQFRIVIGSTAAGAAVATHNFTFNATGAPDTDNGVFDSLATLATAINADTGLSARVVNGRIYIASSDADQSLTFSNVDATDFVAALGLSNVAHSGGDERFASIGELQAIIDADSNLSATTVLDPTEGANFTFSALATTTATGAELVINDTSADGLVSELGLAETGTAVATGGVGDAFFTELGFNSVIDSTVVAGAAREAPSSIIAVSYAPSDDTKNMAGGNITAHFSRNVTVFDALGTGHDFKLSFLKVGQNLWSAELFSLVPTEISGRDDGQVATGIIEFNGDGSLRSVPTSLLNDLDITWSTSGSSQTSFSLDFGTAGSASGTAGASVIGLTDGLRQFDASYNVEFVEQNGVSAGQFNGIEIDEDGTVNAKFSNGEVKAIYKLPVITVPNQNSLQAKSGNVFSVTQASGEVNLKDAGSGGAGVIVPGALEGSTSDIAEELTGTIGIQSSYNANATLISTIRDMEDELNRRLG